MEVHVHVIRPTLAVIKLSEYHYVKGVALAHSKYLCISLGFIAKIRKLRRHNDSAHDFQSRAHPDKSCELFNQLAKKLVARLIALLAKARKRRCLE